MSPNREHAITKLNGNNYASWNKLLQLVLKRSDLWDVVNGDELKSEDPIKAKEWIKRDQNALTEICLAIEDDLVNQVAGLSTSKEAWDFLKGQFIDSSLHSRLFLRRKFNSARMNEGDSMRKHLNRMKEIADELSIIGAPVSDEDYATAILASLPDSYNNWVISYGLMIKSDSGHKFNVGSLTASLLNEEMRRQGSSISTPSTVLAANKSRIYTQQRSLQPSKKLCWYCNKPGHVARFCYKRLADEEKEKEKEKGFFLKCSRFSLYFLKCPRFISARFLRI
jgi:hypothetical protein